MAVVHIATAAATAIVIQIVAITTTTGAIWRFILGTLHHAITGAEEYHHMRSGVSLATKPTISIPIRSSLTKADASGATRHLIDTGKKAGPRPGFFIAPALSLQWLSHCNGFIVIRAFPSHPQCRPSSRYVACANCQYSSRASVDMGPGPRMRSSN